MVADRALPVPVGEDPDRGAVLVDKVVQVPVVLKAVAKAALAPVPRVAAVKADLVLAEAVVVVKVVLAQADPVAAAAKAQADPVAVVAKAALVQAAPAAVAVKVAREQVELTASVPCPRLSGLSTRTKTVRSMPRKSVRLASR